jgi:LCP family protein required for cell wall assembly
VYDTRLREKKARRHRRLKVLGKGVTAAAVLAVIAAVGLTWGAKQWAGSKIRQVSALDLNSSAIVDAAKQAGSDNFLVIGSDARPGAEAEDKANAPRSDTIMLVHVPKNHGRVVVLSFPRDLEVDRPACERWNGTGYDGRRDGGERAAKLNSAFQYGGPRCATRTIQQLTGVAVNHYVGLDFGGFKSVVDAVGGVRMCVAQPVTDAELGPLVDKAGPVELNGDRALAFVRARNVAGDPTSDYGRIHRQQRMLAAVVRAALSDRVLGDPAKLGRLANALSAATVTDNVGVDGLVQLGRALGGLDAGRVTFVTVPTTGLTTSNGNEELRAEDAKALFQAIIADGPLPNEAPAGAPDQSQTGPPPPVTVAPDQIKLQVVNGTGEDGLASQTASKLRDGGFDVVKVANGEAAPRTIVHYASSHEQQARTVAAAVPGATLEIDEAMGGAVEVVLGKDFDGVIKPVQVGQSTPAAGPQAPPQPVVILDTLSGSDTSCA